MKDVLIGFLDVIACVAGIFISILIIFMLAILGFKFVSWFGGLVL